MGTQNQDFSRPLPKKTVFRPEKRDFKRGVATTVAAPKSNKVKVRNDHLDIPRDPVPAPERKKKKRVIKSSSPKIKGSSKKTKPAPPVSSDDLDEKAAEFSDDEVEVIDLEDEPLPLEDDLEESSADGFDDVEEEDDFADDAGLDDTENMDQ